MTRADWVNIAVTALIVAGSMFFVSLYGPPHWALAGFGLTLWHIVIRRSR